MRYIGKYEITGELGKGGMGIVYRAFDRLLEREVALKTQRVEETPGDQSVERFFREARLIASLNHRNIVTVYDLGQDGETVFIVMELLQGEDLSVVLQSGKHVPLEEKVRYVREVAEGLAHAHAKGIVHRDIKPRNVFITDEGEVKLLDFGLAHIAQSNLTRAGQVLGTPHYMSPEQVLGQTPDPRSDIFALGSLFYELLTGEKAFAAKNIQRVLDGIMSRDPKPLRELSPAMPEELSRIVSKMLAKSLDRRYANVPSLIRDLDRFGNFLTRCKVQLRAEIHAKVREIGYLADAHRSVLVERGIDPRTKRLTETASRADLSFMALVGLRDGADVELNRLSNVLERAGVRARGGHGYAPPLEPDSEIGNQQTVTITPVAEVDLEMATERRRRDQKAARAFDEAQARFDDGDLAGSLVCVTDALRLSPTHKQAAELAEQVRSGIVAMVDRWEESESSHQMDVLVAALLAMGENENKDDSLTRSTAHGGSSASSDMIASLSKVFLASLPDVDDVKRKRRADARTKQHPVPSPAPPDPSGENA
jgi:serine/threonine protein kinase